MEINMNELKNSIEKINIFLEKNNCSDFRIKSYDGHKLSLIGSFDLCYYHEIEIIFYNVYRISMDTMFCVDCDKNPFQFHKLDYENGMFEVVITSDCNYGKTEQSIIFKNMDLIIERVKYFDNA